MAIFSSKQAKIYIISEKNANYINQWVLPKANFDISKCNRVSYDKILWKKEIKGHFRDFKGEKWVNFKKKYAHFPKVADFEVLYIKK